MITINQEIEKGIKAAPLDADCDSFNEVISALTDYVDEGIAAGIFESAIQYYLQILKSVSIHFVDDCHYDTLMTCIVWTTRCNILVRNSLKPIMRVR